MEWGGGERERETDRQRMSEREKGKTKKIQDDSHT